MACGLQAIYNAAGDVASPSELQHYGLAADIYTHFTSPIRRYEIDGRSIEKMDVNGHRWT